MEEYKDEILEEEEVELPEALFRVETLLDALLKYGLEPAHDSQFGAKVF